MAAVTLVSSDGQHVVIDAATAKMCTMVRAMADSIDIDSPIELPVVSAATLAKVVEYCTRHAPAACERVPSPVPWAREATTNSAATRAYLEAMEQTMLFDVLIAANYLGVAPLVDAVCEFVANLIKGKTVEEIRRTFNIQSDFSAEEERRLLEENQWAFEQRQL